MIKINEFFQNLNFVLILKRLSQITRPIHTEIPNPPPLTQENNLTEYEFQDQIPLIEARITKNPNNLWVYDNDRMTFKTYREMYNERENATLEGLEYEHPSFRITEDLKDRPDELWEDLRRRLMLKRDFVKRQREFQREDPFMSTETGQDFLNIDNVEWNKQRNIKKMETILADLNDNAHGQTFEMPELEFDENGDLILDESEEQEE